MNRRSFFGVAAVPFVKVLPLIDEHLCPPHCPICAKWVRFDIDASSPPQPFIMSGNAFMPFDISPPDSRVLSGLQTFTLVDSNLQSKGVEMVKKKSKTPKDVNPEQEPAMREHEGDMGPRDGSNVAPEVGDTGSVNDDEVGDAGDEAMAKSNPDEPAREDLPDGVTAKKDSVSGEMVYTVTCEACGATWPTTPDTDRTKCPRCNKIRNLT